MIFGPIRSFVSKKRDRIMLSAQQQMMSVVSTIIMLPVTMNTTDVLFDIEGGGAGGGEGYEGGGEGAGGRLGGGGGQHDSSRRETKGSCTKSTLIASTVHGVPKTSPSPKRKQLIAFVETTNASEHMSLHLSMVLQSATGSPSSRRPLNVENSRWRCRMIVASI